MILILANIIFLIKTCPELIYAIYSIQSVASHPASHHKSKAMWGSCYTKDRSNSP